MSKKTSNPGLNPEAMGLLNRMGVYYDEDRSVLHTKLSTGGFNYETVSGEDIPNKVRNLRRGGTRLPSRLLAVLPLSELSRQEKHRVNTWKKRHKIN